MCAVLQGVGRRYANLVCKKADVDMNKRAGELTEEEVSSVLLFDASGSLLIGECALWGEH